MEANSTVTLALTEERANPRSYPSSGCCFAGDFRPYKCPYCQPLASVWARLLVNHFWNVSAGWKESDRIWTGREIPSKAVVARGGAGSPEVRLHTHRKPLSIKKKSKKRWITSSTWSTDRCRFMFLCCRKGLNVSSTSCKSSSNSLPFEIWIVSLHLCARKLLAWI